MRFANLRSWLAALVAALTPAHIVRARRLRQRQHLDAVRSKAKEWL